MLKDYDMSRTNRSDMIRRANTQLVTLPRVDHCRIIRVKQIIRTKPVPAAIQSSPNTRQSNSANTSPVKTEILTKVYAVKVPRTNTACATSEYAQVANLTMHLDLE